MFRLFISLGRKTLSFFFFVGGMSRLASQTFYWMLVPPYKKERIFEQAKRAGTDPLC